MIVLEPGRGGCGNCGHKLERLNSKTGGILLTCAGCGIVVGKGDDAEKIIHDEVEAGRGKLIDAAPGLIAMRLTGGPSS